MNEGILCNAVHEAIQNVLDHCVISDRVPRIISYFVKLIVTKEINPHQKKTHLARQKKVLQKFNAPDSKSCTREASLVQNASPIFPYVLYTDLLLRSTGRYVVGMVEPSPSWRWSKESPVLGGFEVKETCCICCLDCAYVLRRVCWGGNGRI